MTEPQMKEYLMDDPEYRKHKDKMNVLRAEYKKIKQDLYKRGIKADWDKKQVTKGVFL